MTPPRRHFRTSRSSRLLVCAAAALAVSITPAIATAATPTPARPPGAALAALAVPTARYADVSRTLRVGATGPDVRNVQKRLHKPVTGHYTEQLARAVANFQRNHRLRATGVVDAKTWRVLKQFTSTRRTVQYGSRGPVVKDLQRRLRVTPVSGWFGPRTEAAVKTFQRRHHLRPNGVVNGRTWAVLLAATAGGSSDKRGSRSSGSRTCPVAGAQFSDTFGASRGDHGHKGVDMLAPAGTPIRAIESGTVAIAHWSGSSGGWTITLQGRSGAKFFHAHNQKNLVRGGERVTKGQVIAKVGSTGNAGISHLHFEYWPSGREGAAVNPTPLIASLC